MTKLLFVLLAIGFVDKCRGANISYNFEEEATETVLASLELSSLPATHTEIVGLTFTAEGQEIFGYGSEYLGTFDLTVRQISDDGSGGLRFGLIHDNDPVDSTFHEIFGTFRVALRTYPSTHCQHCYCSSPEGSWIGT